MKGENLFGQREECLEVEEIVGERDKGENNTMKNILLHYNVFP